MTPIEIKAAQLRGQGVPFPPFFMPLPLPGGGQMFAIPGIPVAIFQAPGSTQAFSVQGDILARYAVGPGPQPLA